MPTLVRKSIATIRVKDLVDLLLLVRTQMQPRRLRENIERTFVHRLTHQMPMSLVPPPRLWRPRFAELAARCGINVDIDTAAASTTTSGIYDPVFPNETPACR
jgi:hypothetical protein